MLMKMAKWVMGQGSHNKIKRPTATGSGNSSYAHAPTDYDILYPVYDTILCQVSTFNCKVFCPQFVRK